jgi:methyl-accepting chemotaxis protein
MHVTQKEYTLPADLVILSTSDLQGNIIDYNIGFRDASGYSDTELAGKPHSLLRHPDMPKAAFKDFWTTIQAGLPWYGIVKNKRKDGDHYWVQANAAPIIEQGKITGFLSVRYPATREQIAQAERSYAAINKGQMVMPLTQVKPAILVPSIVGVLSVVMMLLGAVVLENNLSTLAVFIGASASLTIGYLVAVIWRLSKPNKDHQKAIEAISNGDLKKRFEGNDPWMFVLNNIRSRVAESLARQYDTAKESAVLTTAMNAASTNLMVSDVDFNIISINRSLEQMFHDHEGIIKSFLPQFNAASVVGCNMDIFHKNPSHQRAMVERLTQPWTGVLDLGALVFRLTVNPIYMTGQKTGYVVEWYDQTQEAILERQLARITEATDEGIFHHRIDVTHAQGVSLALGKAVNGLLQTLSNFTANMVHTIGDMAFSRLDINMQGDYKGVFANVQRAVNLSMRNLNEALGHVHFTAQDVSQAMAQLNVGVNHFSDKTQEQAAAIEQTSAGMVQILSLVRSNAENVQHANTLTKGVHDQVEDGHVVMQQALHAMQRIHESGSKISDIVSLIDGIAFQTNLLALNAAVEAARAGEHGKGFAVVASEVRGLAEKSANAAKDIKSLIDASVEQISQGTQLVQKTSLALTDIRHSVDEMSEVVVQISKASEEQAQGVDEINHAITVMDNVSQQSAALVEQTAASATHVAEQIESLYGILQHFKLSKAGQETARFGSGPLEEMKQSHLNWTIRVGNVIQGLEKITDINSLGNHHLCGLGKWRNSVGLQYAHFPEVQELDVMHADFHKAVAESVQLVNEGRVVEAQRQMLIVEALSGRVVDQLTLIEQVILNR